MTATKNLAAQSTCLCGCGQETSAKSYYRPGHDASHVSILLADIIAGKDLSTDVVAKYKAGLPSDALRIKFERAVDNYADRQANRKPRNSRTEWVDCDTYDYKIGRWVYPVQVKMYKVDAQGLKPGQESEYLGYRRNTKRDGSGEWVDLEGGELIGL